MLSVFFSSKCSLFHNSNIFGSCIIHILYTGCAKIKKNSGAKSLNNWRIKNQLDATYYFIVLLVCSTCFGHYCDHHQELTTMILFTALVVSFCKFGGGSINAKLCFLVLCFWCEVFFRLVVAGSMFLLILIAVIFYVW